jgi:hypothetical protein
MLSSVYQDIISPTGNSKECFEHESKSRMYNRDVEIMMGTTGYERCHRRMEDHKKKMNRRNRGKTEIHRATNQCLGNSLCPHHQDCMPQSAIVPELMTGFHSPLSLSVIKSTRTVGRFITSQCCLTWTFYATRCQ